MLRAYNSYQNKRWKKLKIWVRNIFPKTTKFLCIPQVFWKSVDNSSNWIGQYNSYPMLFPLDFLNGETLASVTVADDEDEEKNDALLIATLSYGNLHNFCLFWPNNYTCDLHKYLCDLHP